MKKVQFKTTMKYVNMVVLILLCLVVLESAKAPDFTLKEGVVGSWKYDGYSLDTVKLVRVPYFNRDNKGIKFKTDGSLVKRQNSGWCGTPPITYANYNGTWKVTSDSTLHINHDYWGGTMQMDWKLVSSTENSIVFVVTHHETIKE